MFTFNSVKKAILLELIYRCKVISIKTPAGFFCRNSQAVPKIDIEMQKTENTPNHFKKKKIRELILPISKLTVMIQ